MLLVQGATGAPEEDAADVHQQERERPGKGVWGLKWSKIQVETSPEPPTPNAFGVQNTIMSSLLVYILASVHCNGR